MDLIPQRTLEVATSNGDAHDGEEGTEELPVPGPYSDPITEEDGPGDVQEDEYEQLLEDNQVVEELDEDIGMEETTEEVECDSENLTQPWDKSVCEVFRETPADTLENHFKGFVKLGFVDKCSENTPRCSTGESSEEMTETLTESGKEDHNCLSDRAPKCSKSSRELDVALEETVRDSVLVSNSRSEPKTGVSGASNTSVKELSRLLIQRRANKHGNEDGDEASGSRSNDDEGDDLDGMSDSEAGEDGYQDDDEAEKESWDGERDYENDMEAACSSCQRQHEYCTTDRPPVNLAVDRQLDETPPFDVETEESPCHSICGSPPPLSHTSHSRKRKLDDVAASDEDCWSKKIHPDTERDKTDGRACKLLHKERPPPHVQAWLQEINSWPKAEQNLGLERLLATICDSHQLRLVRQLIEPHFQRDFISLLPKELALHVLSFLEPRDLVKAAQTCSTWRFLAEDNLLWREKCRESGIKVLPRRRKCSTWKAAFMRQHRIEWNWRTQTIRGMQYLRGHDDHVITCLQFAYNRIVSGSDDNTLKVWNCSTGKCLKTLVGHTGGVWSSQMNETIIISGSTDRTLKVWDAETGECLHTLYGHTSTVRCMHLHGNKVVSGSRDATLRVWDVESGECLYVLVGHLAAVRCVQYDGKLIVSGAYDYMVKVWNPEREECLHTLQGHTNRVYSLQFDGIHVVSGSLDTSIRVWDVETGALKHTLMGHQSLTSGMELRENILVSGNADSTVKVWDIVTGQCLQTLSGANKHQSAVTCLQFNRRFVITSSDDGTVKLWDVKTGEFIRNLVTLYSGGSGGVVWRIRANETKLVCAVGSRNGTEETKLVVLDFDVDRPS